MKRSREFAHRIASAQETTQRGDKWQAHFSGLRSYEFTFKYLLKDDSLKKIMERWPDHDQVAGIDLMGSGTVFEGLGLKHGLGVALTDARPSDMRARHDGKIDVVAGNILERKTWNEIATWLQRSGLKDPHFKLALFRPVGGINTIPNDPSTMYALLQRLWKMMSNENSELFAVIPHDISKLVEAWVEKLNATPGINARLQTTQEIIAADQGLSVMQLDSPTPSIRLTKNQVAPDQLPTMDFVADSETWRNSTRYLPKQP